MRDTRPDPTRGVLSHILQRLTAPHPSLQQVEQRRKAQLLATLIVALIPISIPSVILAAIIYTPEALFQDQGFSLILLVIILCCMAYILSRSAYYVTGAVLIIVMASSGIMGVAFLSQLYDTYFLGYLILPVLLSNIFLSSRHSIYLLAIYLATVAFFSLLLPQFTFVGLLAGPMMLVLVISTILIITNRYRNMLEQDHRAALEESENRYRMVSELMSDYAYGIRITEDGSSATEWIAGAFSEMTGYSTQDIQASGWELLIHPEDRSLYRDRLYRLRDGTADVSELRIITHDGETRWLRDYGRPIWNDHEQRVVAIYGAAQDITERKQAETAEREQRILAEAMRDTAAVLTSTLNLEGVLDRILASVARVIPHDAGNIMLVQANIASVVRYHKFGDFEVDTPERHIPFDITKTPTLRRMAETGEPLLVSNTEVSPDWVPHGNIGRWIKSYIGMPIRSGDRVVGFLNIDSSQVNGFNEKHLEQIQVFANQATIAIRNATLFDELEQRVAQRTAELESERRQFRAILDSMGEGVYYAEGKHIHYINAMLSRLTGYDSDEIAARTTIDLISPHNPQTPEEIRQEIRTTLVKEGVWRKEIRMTGKDGRDFDAGLTVSRVSEPDADLLRTVTVVRDISQEKALEARKNHFISTASHELRTPITNITTRLYLIRRQPENLTEHLNIIEGVTERMMNLAENLLDMSRLEHGQINLDRQVVILQELVLAVIHAQSAEADLKNIAFTSSLTDEPLRVLADTERMIQVITNLVTNAINYTPEGGSVTVTLKIIPDEENKNRQAFLEVVDTGIGIAPKHLPHIFESFYRIDQKVKGTGLGLSISREIIRLHGGEIDVRSTLGEGSTFSITLALIE